MCDLMVATVSKPSIQSIPSIPTRLLQRTLRRLILAENSFQFNGKNYLEIHGTAMGTKMVVAFANIFMAKVETDLKSKCFKTAHLETIH